MSVPEQHVLTPLAFVIVPDVSGIGIGTVGVPRIVAEDDLIHGAEGNFTGLDVKGS